MTTIDLNKWRESQQCCRYHRYYDWVIARFEERLTSESSVSSKRLLDEHVGTLDQVVPWKRSKFPTIGTATNAEELLSYLQRQRECIHRDRSLLWLTRAYNALMYLLYGIWAMLRICRITSGYVWTRFVPGDSTLWKIFCLYLIVPLWVVWAQHEWILAVDSWMYGAIIDDAWRAAWIEVEKGLHEEPIWLSYVLSYGLGYLCFAIYPVLIVCALILVGIQSLFTFNLDPIWIILRLVGDLTRTSLFIGYAEIIDLQHWYYESGPDFVEVTSIDRQAQEYCDVLVDNSPSEKLIFERCASLMAEHYQYRMRAEQILSELKQHKGIDNYHPILNRFWTEGRLNALQQVQSEHMENQAAVEQLLTSIESKGVTIEVDIIPITDGVVEYLRELDELTTERQQWQERASAQSIELEPAHVILNGQIEMPDYQTMVVHLKTNGWRGVWMKSYYPILLSEECAYFQANHSDDIEWTAEVHTSCLAGEWVPNTCRAVRRNADAITSNDALDQLMTTDVGLKVQWWTLEDTSTFSIRTLENDLLKGDYHHPVGRDTEWLSAFGWVLDDTFEPTMPQSIQMAFDKWGLEKPPMCERVYLTQGYSKTLNNELESAFQRLEQGRDLRERFRQIEGDPELNAAKWFGVQQDLGGSEQPIAFPFPLLTKDALNALDAELTQYESDFVAMKALRKRAKGLQVDTTKWQPPYDVAAYTKQVELAEQLIEEMTELIPKAKTLHVDLKQTTIFAVPVLQRPYQKNVVKQLSVELTRIEGFIEEWNTARNEAFKVGYTFPSTLPADKMTSEAIKWHTQYISQAPTVRKLMRQFEMVTIPKGEFLYLDFYEPFVVDHSFQMARTELTEEIYCVVMGLEETENRQCRDNYPVVIRLSSAKLFMKVLSFQMGMSCDASFEICNKGYRIPTRTEWRYAASAKQHYYYAGAHNPYDVAWIDEGVMPVGMKEPNAWGLYDMSGNRIEWVDTLSTNDDSRYEGAGEKSIRDRTGTHIWHSRTGFGIRLVYDTLSTETVSWYQK